MRGDRLVDSLVRLCLGSGPQLHGVRFTLGSLAGRVSLPLCFQLCPLRIGLGLLNFLLVLRLQLLKVCLLNLLLLLRLRLGVDGLAELRIKVDISEGDVHAIGHDAVLC